MNKYETYLHIVVMLLIGFSVFLIGVSTEPLDLFFGVMIVFGLLFSFVWMVRVVYLVLAWGKNRGYYLTKYS